jgi:hypothetical protein
MIFNFVSKFVSERECVLACAHTKQAKKKGVENGGAPSVVSFTQYLFPLFLAKFWRNFDLKNMVSNFDLYKRFFVGEKWAQIRQISKKKIPNRQILMISSSR